MTSGEHVSESEIAALRSAIEASTRGNAILTTSVAVLTETTKTLKESVEKMQATSVSKDAFDSVVSRLAKVEATLGRLGWLVIGAVIAAGLGFILHVNGTTLP